MDVSSRLLVLVVDDEPLMRWALSATLGEAGHVVREAVDEAAAVRLVLDASPPFDVVLLGLPPRESLDVTALRTITRHSPTSAVIVMTANDTDAIRDRAAALGGSRVLITPFDLRHVADVCGWSRRDPGRTDCTPIRPHDLDTDEAIRAENSRSRTFCWRSPWARARRHRCRRRPGCPHGNCDDGWAVDRSPIFDADSAGDGWRRFHALFPNAQGYVAVSAPVYPGQTATIDVTANCGDVCGFGWLVQLTQQAIAWEVRDARLVWVS